MEYQRIQNAAEYVQSKIGSFRPAVAAVLGSGLGAYAESGAVQKLFEISYADIPDFPVSTVPGHAGKFVFGYVGGIPAALMAGRVHQYEGYSAADTVLPIRILHLAGASALLLTNAAGGINRTFRPGDLMLIRDQISCFVPSPLRGENVEALGPRFPDMTEIYSARFCDIAKTAAQKLGFSLQEGVYLQVPGPQYETPAEIRMMGLLGADAVGMSTACEAIAARHMGMEVCGISCITNPAAGLGGEPLSHEEVQRNADLAALRFRSLLTELLPKLIFPA